MSKSKKEKQEEKRKKKEKKKRKQTLKKILKFFSAGLIGTFIVGIIIPEIIGNIVPHLMPPMYTNISIPQDESKQPTAQPNFWGKIAQYDKACRIYFMDSECKREINFDNYNDSFMCITDVCVNVIKCTDILEKEITDVRGTWTGDIKEPIYLKTKIKHNTGKMETEIDWKETGVSNDSYIEISGNTSEKFILLMDFEKQGYYSIEVEFTYRYNGKERTIKTEPLDCIFIEKNMEDSQLIGNH